MKKYIFSREKLQEDSDVAEITENMNWPKDAEGCEVIFPGDEEKGFAITKNGYKVSVYPEWCEVVESNEPEPTTVPNP